MSKGAIDTIRTLTLIALTLLAAWALDGRTGLGWAAAIIALIVAFAED